MKRPAPLTVDQLIAALEAVRAEHGGGVPVIMADGEPVVRAGVFFHAPIEERVRAALACEDEPAARPHCVVAGRYQDDGGEWAAGDDTPAELPDAES
jgi:hypothetical protein